MTRPTLLPGDPVFVLSVRAMAAGEQRYGYVQAVALRRGIPTLPQGEGSTWVVCVALHGGLSGCHVWFDPQDLARPCELGAEGCTCFQCRMAALGY